MSGGRNQQQQHQLWLDAFYSVSLHLKAECGIVLLALEDLAKDGADRLVTLLVGEQFSQLRIVRGTELQCEIVLPQMAAALCTFSMDGSLPGIAVGAGSSLYIYKNFKPYYKYTIPHGGPNNDEEAQITQLTALPRSSPDVSASTLLLIGTEHNSMLIIDPQTFTAISRVELPGVPKLIKCSGYYDVEALILVATDNSRLFLLRSNVQPMDPQMLITMDAPLVDVAFNGSVIAVATSDHSVTCYTTQGQEMRKMSFETFVQALVWVEMKNQDLSMLAVTLADGSVLFYRQGSMVQKLHFNSGIISMVFGRFGREDGVLVMVSKEGDLIVKILNRGFKLGAVQQQTAPAGPDASSSTVKKNKPLWPAKTKIFVEQALREQEDPKKMYQQFQEGLCRAHLRALQEHLQTGTKQLQQPAMMEEQRRCIHLLAKLSGSTGTRRQLQLLIQNISKQVIEGLTVMLHVNSTSNKLAIEEPSCRLVGLLLPSSEHWITVNVQDPTNQGGQVYIIVTKDLPDEDGSPIIRGQVVYSAKVDIAPTI